MAKRIFASVKPEILVWARTSSGLSEEAVAQALKLPIEIIKSWESSGDDLCPSIPQLRTLANLYKRPLAAFYLQEVPTKFQVLTDLRRPILGEDRPFSSALTQEVRFAQQRRELALELLKDLDEPINAYQFRLKDEPAEVAGGLIREFLGLNFEEIKKFNSDSAGRLGLNTWRIAIEASGVLVFQSSAISQAEASGFALAYETMPVVVINRKDSPQRRLFSLLHEYAHVLLRTSGVSDLNFENVEHSDTDVELRCNAIAAAALMPIDMLVAELGRIDGNSHAAMADEDIARVARRFGVSRPALLLRLIGLGYTTWDFYFKKVAQYNDEFERSRAARPPVSGMRRNMPQESLSNLGRSFVGLVLGNYHQRRITLSDVSGYLGIRVKHVESLQRIFAR